MKAKSMVLAIKHGVFANIHKQTPLCLGLGCDFSSGEFELLLAPRGFAAYRE